MAPTAVQVWRVQCGECSSSNSRSSSSSSSSSRSSNCRRSHRGAVVSLLPEQPRPLLQPLWLPPPPQHALRRAPRSLRLPLPRTRHARWFAALLCASCAGLATAQSQRPVTDFTGWGELPEIGEKDDLYYESLRADYKYRPIDNVAYRVDIRIDPCRDSSITGGVGDKCCKNTNNLVSCQHYSDVEAGYDLQLAFFTNAHIPNCKGTPFERSPDCGTFLEIHRIHPDEVEYHRVLHDQAVDQAPVTNGFQTIRIATNKLCLGEHEIWWVIRTRSGPYVLLKQMFMVVKPSCEGPEDLVEAPEFRIPPPEVP